jgi:hypothetical protein
MTLGGHPEVHILGDEFYSQTPYLFGTYMAKFSRLTEDRLMAKKERFQEPTMLSLLANRRAPARTPTKHRTSGRGHGVSRNVESMPCCHAFVSD